MTQRTESRPEERTGRRTSDRLHRNATVLVALAAWFMVAAEARAADARPLDDAVSAHSRGDYATALRLLRPLADQGAADAQYTLGVMHYKGQGVPRDYAEAARWYQKAAEQGLAEAQFNLGFMYANGQGVPLDYGDAVRWYRKAADQGLASAQHNLGVLYANGQGVPQDFVKAYKWLSLAVSQPSPSHDMMVKTRDRVAATMTPEQIAEAKKLAREWKPN
jgi:TPR repeat protein